MHEKTFVCVVSCILTSTIVQGAPQGNGFDTFSEVFKLCSDLESEGFSFDRGVNEKKDMPISLYGHTATIFGPTKILICGGCNDVCDDRCGGCNVVNECEKNVRKTICKS